MKALISCTKFLYCRNSIIIPILSQNVYANQYNIIYPKIFNRFISLPFNARFYSNSTKNSQNKSYIKNGNIKDNSQDINSKNNTKKVTLETGSKDSKSEASIRRAKEMQKFKNKVSEKSEKFKLFALLTLKKYGKLGAITYFGVYITTLTGFTLASYNGFLSGDDIKKGLKLLHMEHIKCPDLDGKFGRFFVAYIACKMVEPIRLVATIIIVTVLSRIMSIRALKGTILK